MFVLIKRYIDKMSMDDLNNFALKNNVSLSQEELSFTYSYVKKNYETILRNYTLFDFDKYKEYYSEENYIKIKKLIKEYMIKYGKYLK